MGQATISTGKFEVPHHAPDHGQLRGVFLSEESRIRLDDVKQLRDDRGHAAEMAGTRASVELLAQAFDHHPASPLPAGYISSDRRGKENFHAFFFEQLAIAFELARIFCQIFGRPKLRGIHKDGNGDRITLRLGGAHQ